MADMTPREANVTMLTVLFAAKIVMPVEIGFYEMGDMAGQLYVHVNPREVSGKFRAENGTRNLFSGRSRSPWELHKAGWTADQIIAEAERRMPAWTRP